MESPLAHAPVLSRGQSSGTLAFSSAHQLRVEISANFPHSPCHHPSRWIKPSAGGATLYAKINYRAQRSNRTGFRAEPFSQEHLVDLEPGSSGTVSRTFPSRLAESLP